MPDLAIKKPRPKHLDLMVIRLPLPGIASILHRISGAGLFLLLPFLIWLLDLSLATPESFATFKAVAGNPLAKLILLGLLWALLHHLCMGIRILLIDIHIGVDKAAANLSAKIVFAVSIALTVLLGVKLW